MPGDPDRREALRHDREHPTWHRDSFRWIQNERNLWRADGPMFSTVGRSVRRLLSD